MIGLSAIRSEGAILPQRLLARVRAEDGKLGGLKPEDYGLSGERLREAASRAWNALQGAWASFSQQREKLASNDAGTSLTRTRWLYPLLRALDYGVLDLLREKPIIEGREFPISHLYGHVPIHTVGFTIELDARTKGMTPHGTVQTLLNASDDYLWGIVTNGLRWRLLRDSASLSRQAMVEFDLEAIFTGQLYDEFLLFFLLCHQSRVKSEKPEECWLEKWSKAAGEEGKRALDTLRDGVQSAIEVLGQGFLRCPQNVALRERVRSGQLEKQDYYRQLLRQVYRLLFLFVAEDRGLLFAPDATEAARETFTRFYGTQRLRRLAERLRGSGRHADLFQQYRVVTGKLADPHGCPTLGLPALGGFLFASSACPDLDGADIANQDFLLAIRHLAVTQEGGRQTRVDYRNLGSEEFGSVYESLLELHPELRSDGTAFSLISASGNERKTTGSYYTPDSLIQVLLDEALEPVIDAAVKQPDPEQAILNLKVVDPAAGSGHFLIAAAHRLARRLAQIRTGDEEPSPEATRHALRDVIGRCLYAVDLNPMAVELCKVALWMEALEPGKPLSFLDHHIQCGNSLLGATPALLKDGIPDAAFTAIEGDDKAVCTEFKKKNRDTHKGILALPFDEAPPWERQGELASAMLSISAVDDGSVEGVAERASRWEKLVASSAYENNRLLADAWCAAFVWKKHRSDTVPLYPITQEHFLALRISPYGVESWIRDEVVRLSEQYQFFHWHLAFPDVFGPNGERGFDVVLGNPPWDQIQLDPREFFAVSRPDIAEAANMSARDKMIDKLAISDPALFVTYQDAIREINGIQHFIHTSGRFPLTSFGRLNTYSLFAELSRSIINSKGFLGIIVPTGIATDSFNQYFFCDIVDKKSLKSFFGFKNERFLFPKPVEHTVTFGLLSITGSDIKCEQMEFMWLCWSVEEMADRNRHIILTPEDILLLNPNTKTCPIFYTTRDAGLTKSIFTRIPILIKDSDPGHNYWGLKFQLMFMMNTDSHLFKKDENDKEIYCPLYEAKMVHHFDHRFSTYENATQEQLNLGTLPRLTEEQKANPDHNILPRYWVEKSEVISKLRKQDKDKTIIWSWTKDWLLGWRDIARNTDQRTVISSIIPVVGVGNKFPLLFPENDDACLAGCLVTNLNAFVLDYVARQKVGGTTLNFFYAKQFPILPPETYSALTPWANGETIGAWIAPRVLELTYTAYDMAPFARDCGYHGEPFIWNDERRFQLRCELDAAYFHLYGINREDVDYIMGTFPIVKRKDEATYGTYRTCDRILEIYDQMASGAFVSLLNPLPAHGWTPDGTVTLSPSPKSITDADIEPAILTWLIARERDMGLVERYRRNPVSQKVWQPDIKETHQVRLAKKLYAVQEMAGVSVGTYQERKPWGPLSTSFYSALDQAFQKGWLISIPDSDSKAIAFKLGPNAEEALIYASDKIQGKEQDLEDILFYMEGDNLLESERQATVHKAWSDIVARGESPSVERVISEVQQWKPNRAGFSVGEIRITFADLKSRNLCTSPIPVTIPNIPAQNESPSADRDSSSASRENKAQTPPDLGTTDDTAPLTLALPVGRVTVNGQPAELLEKTPLGGGKVAYRVVLDATGEIKSFQSPPAVVEEAV